MRVDSNHLRIQATTLASESPLPTRRSIRVAISTWGADGGAMATIAAGLAKGFDELDCSVDVLRINDLPPADHLGFPPDTRHVCLQRRSRTSFLPLARYLRSSQPDVLICVGSVQNPPGLAAKLLSGYKGLLLLNEQASLSDPMFDESQPSLTIARPAWFARHFYRYADAVVAVSESVRDELWSLGLGATRPLVAIPNPVDLTRVRRLATEDHGGIGSIRHGGPLFVSVGRLAREKNHALLIRAFSRFREDYGVGELVIVGEGPLRTELEALVCGLDLSGYVRLPGLIQNPYPIIAAADAFVLPSEREGFGLVLVEAMALRKPIVAVNCPGGVAEVLDYGRAGLLVDPGSAVRLSEAMSSIIHDGALRATIVANGDARAHSFQPVLVARQWLALVDIISARDPLCA